MQSKLPPGKAGERAIRVVASLLGGILDWRALALLMGLGLSLNLLASWVVLAGPRWTGCASVVFLAFLLIWFQSGARRVARNTDPVVAVNLAPAKAKVLVLFLSLPRDLTVISGWIADPRFQGGILKKEVRDAMGGESWRMPVEAIAHHIGELQNVVLIGSSDRGKVRGTAVLATTFRELLKHLTEGQPKRIEVVSAFELTGADEFETGVDFEDAPALAAVLAAIQRTLANAKYRPRDILIDITSGQKLPSAVAAAIALGRDQLIQYVSTHDMAVHCYDITYRPAE